MEVCLVKESRFHSCLFVSVCLPREDEAAATRNGVTRDRLSFPLN